MKFAKWLQRKRTDLGYTQKFVAKNLNLSQQSITQWENCISRPNYETLIKVLDFYKCSDEEILELLNIFRVD